MQAATSPLQCLNDPLLEPFGVRVLVKRDDLLHPEISGNKWRKLKYNLEEATREGKKTLLTFGGAYSNHLYATAAAGKLHGFRTIGIVRGDELEAENPTLRFAEQVGMHLHFIDRATYATKYQWEFLDALEGLYGDFYMLPEGGTNILAVKGCAEIVSELDENYDYVCCACGTGGTLAGLAVVLPPGKKAIGVSSLKGGDFLTTEVRQLLRSYTRQFGQPLIRPDAYQLLTDYHFGGYAKTTPELLAFIRGFEERNGIRLEQVYTGKMVFAVYDLIQQGFFKQGETVVLVHTGGLQGRSPELD